MDFKKIAKNIRAIILKLASKNTSKQHKRKAARGFPVGQMHNINRTMDAIKAKRIAAAKAAEKLRLHRERQAVSV